MLNLELSPVICVILFLFSIVMLMQRRKRIPAFNVLAVNIVP